MSPAGLILSAAGIVGSVVLFTAAGQIVAHGAGGGAVNTAWAAPIAAAGDSLPPIRWNDNEASAGVLRDEALSVELTVGWGAWHLLGEERPAARVLAFGEVGKELQNPGPMIRVPLGTEIRVRLANPLGDTLVVRGLCARRLASLTEIVIPPGETREARFPADAAGTYYYWGATTGAGTIRARSFEDSQLSGAFIVDAPGGGPEANERVMMLGIWIDGKWEDGSPDFDREFLVINGRPWPYTERLTYAMGDSVRWRLINASRGTHPMHLHGFFYRVDSRGNLARDTIYWPAQRRMAVTERMAPGTTLSLAWSPDRPGGWIFHCHNSFHVIENPGLGTMREDSITRFRRMLLGRHRSPVDPDRYIQGSMGGLLMAIYVRPPEGWQPNEPRRRKLRLFVQSDSAADARTDSMPDPFGFVGPFRRRFAYVLQEGASAPASDSVRLPGSPLVLREGEPTSILVLNRTPEPTQVHWHGLEIESYFDGVAGVGGYPAQTTPLILPGDSFEIRITPPRAGSFMYHTHVNDVRQQTGGLYGPFVVLEADEAWDPEHDRIMIVGDASFDAGVFLNGSQHPEPIEFTAGTDYRLRLMNITLAEGNLRLRIVRDGALERWRARAEDGFDLPTHQRSRVPSEQVVSVGETYDFDYRPRTPGDVHLEVRSRSGRLLVDQLIRVREEAGAG